MELISLAMETSMSVSTLKVSLKDVGNTSGTTVISISASFKKA